jgi:predicted RNA binding protein YcfA (HicA-like mRNA interferase family)
MFGFPPAGATKIISQRHPICAAAAANHLLNPSSPPARVTARSAWFAEFDAAAWDREIEDDVAAGRQPALSDAADCPPRECNQAATLPGDQASAGFVEASQKGSHVKFVRRLGGIVDTAIVPKKHEVPPGTLRSILSQAHIDPDDWEKLG